MRWDWLVSRSAPRLVVPSRYGHCITEGGTYSGTPSMTYPVPLIIPRWTLDLYSPYYYLRLHGQCELILYSTVSQGVRHTNGPLILSTHDVLPMSSTVSSHCVRWPIVGAVHNPQVYFPPSYLPSFSLAPPEYLTLPLR